MPQHTHSNPIVFVSYSHDSPAHSQRVLRLANRLRQEAGCDTILDQYADGTVASWPEWMRSELGRADVVLMVFTRRYRQRFDGEELKGRGLGVMWERTVITNHLYAAGGSSTKFVPVVLREADLALVPHDVFSGTRYLLDRDWRRLVTRLWGRSSSQAPPIGSRPSFASPSRHREVRKNPPPRSARVKPLSVLFVGAERGTSLDLHYQVRCTRKAVESGTLAGRVELKAVYNVTPDDMLMKVTSTAPDVLHVSGKQKGGEIKMHDRRGNLVPVSADRLAQGLVEVGTSLRLVILDTCDSLRQARRLVRKIDCAIGVEGAIAEPVAIDFFAMFFNGLAAGRSVHDAWRAAFTLELSKIEGNSRYQREVEKILEEPFDRDRHLPQLVTRIGVNAKKLTLT